MIDDVRIDSDEGGITLILVGDHVGEVERYLADQGEDALRLRLPQHAALALLRAAEAEIGPWVTEWLREYAAWRQASPEEHAAVLGQDDEVVARGYSRARVRDDQWRALQAIAEHERGEHDGWQAGCPVCEENERAAADLLRKAERERG